MSESAAMKQAIAAISMTIAARMTGRRPRWSDSLPVTSSAASSATA
jgi:hypothetical protein